MPYNKRKQKCKQSSGKAGNYVLSYTTKKGEKRSACHTSEKNMQGQIAAIEAEANEVYGEEINEDIMRILVADFTLQEAQKINTAKHYLDSNTSSTARRPINYMMWINDGMPSTAVPGKPYADDVENFVKFRNSFSAFEVAEEATLITLEPVGDITKDETALPRGTKVQLLEPMSDANVAKNAKAIGKRAPHFVKVRTQDGLEGYFPSLKLGHNLAGSAKGKINDAQIGAAIESVVFAAINGLGRDEAFEMAVEDSRASKYSTATDAEKARFESLMKTGYDAVESYLRGNGAPSFSEPVDPRPEEGEGNTAAVDVPVKAGGQTAEIHVKYNDEKRMFGLRKADGSKASPEFTKARNEVLRQYVPTLESYRAWVSNYKKGDYDPEMVADLSNEDIVSRIKKFGTITIGTGWSPMTRSTSAGASNVFIDPRSLVTNMHKKSGPFQSGISSLMQLDPLLLTKPPFDTVPALLKADVENAIRPNADRAPGGVYYFNFSGKGSTATLKVTAFAADLEVDVVVHNSIAGQSSLSIGYDIQVDVEGEILTPFRIQISSLARGKPLQVEKTDDLKRLLALIDPEKSNEIPERIEKVIEDGIIREIVEELTLISENRTRLIVEELTGADKSEIKRMIAKEIEGASNKRETKKIFQAEFNKELKKALGTSFIGEPGKINKFVKNAISKEIESMFKDKATQNQIGEITKAVMKKLYRELSFSSVHIVDRIKL